MANPLGSTPGIIVGVGVGTAASIALEPAIEVPKQEAWANNPRKILEAAMLARLVSQGGAPLNRETYDAAHRDGFDDDKFDAMVYLEQTTPGLSLALRLWRLDLLSDELFSFVLAKEGLDGRFTQPIEHLKTAELLGIGDIAYGVVRGILPAPSWVPVAPPASGDKVPRFPVVELNPVTLAAKLGFDEDMLKLAVGRSGLSLAPGMAAQAYFRDIIGPNDYLLAIAEGDLRTEWAEAVREVSRQILTSHDAAELQLRGYLSRAERLGKTRAHGMADGDSDLLYDLLGRSINVHQVLIGQRRGGVFNGPTDHIPTEYLQALQRGNLRPEYYDLAFAQRETYPSYFVTRDLARNKIVTQARAEELFSGLGWPEDVTKAAAAFYFSGGTVAADPHVAKAETQLWNATHRSYVGEMSGDTEARDRMTTLHIDAQSQTRILELWQSERALIRKQLTPAQVKKAYHEQVINPTTGVAWTQADALTALADRGYARADALTLLEE